MYTIPHSADTQYNCDKMFPNIRKFLRKRSSPKSSEMRRHISIMGRNWLTHSAESTFCYCDGYTVNAKCQKSFKRGIIIP